MRKIAVVTLNDSRKLFAPKCRIADEGDIVRAEVRNTFRSVKKTGKALDKVPVLVAYGYEKRKAFCGQIKKVCKYEYRTVIPVLEKISRQICVKYKKKIPLEDLYISASPTIACEIIEALRNVSRLFTVVSDEETPPGLYDGIYFKYGTLTRQIPEFNNNISEDAVIIRCRDDYFPVWAKLPVINLVPGELKSDLWLDVWKISVSDSKISAPGCVWGGESGIMFYTLLDEIPAENARVDINKSADEIFLLDTGGF